MFFTPICFLISLYSAFVYGRSRKLPREQKRYTVSGRWLTKALGILYANLGGFGIAFQELRHWGPVTGNLPFLAMLLGMCGAGLMNIYNNKQYFQLYKANGNRPVPEARLPPMMIGGVLFAIGLFLFGCEPRFTDPPIACTDASYRDFESQDKLLAFNHRHFFYRCRFYGNLPIVTQLSRRHFHAVQRQRRGGQHVSASNVRRRIPPLRRAYVS